MWRAFAAVSCDYDLLPDALEPKETVPIPELIKNQNDTRS